MFSLVGMHNYYKAQDEIITRMNEQVEMVQLRASTVLPSLIWNFATDSIRDFSKAELRSEFISGVIVLDGTESLFSGVKRNKNSLIISQIKSFPKNQKQLSFELVYIENGDRTAVGNVHIRFNESYLHDQLNKILWQQVIQSAVYCLVLFALIWLLINRLVLVPILQLNERLNNITNEISQR